MGLDVKEKIQPREAIRVIRGCPCFKVFGNEKLCVNDDSILELDVIEMDPSLFRIHNSKEEIEEEQAEEGNICYLCIYANYPDNLVYCVSQGWNLRIHGKDVKADELEEAMRFLSTTDKSSSAELCSECMYKFLLTLGESFTDVMSEKEKMVEIKRYVDNFSLKIAVKLSQTDEHMDSIAHHEESIDEINHFEVVRNYLIQLQEQQKNFENLQDALMKQGATDWLIELVEKRERLARLEFQFYSQTLQLRSITDFHLLIKVLHFILDSSSRILSLNQEIHDQISSDRFEEESKKLEELDILLNYKEKSRAVEHNFGNILQILGRL